MLVRTQMRTGTETVQMSGGYYHRIRYIGFDYNAIIKVARALDIPINHAFLLNLSLFEREVLEILNNMDEGDCNKKQKESCRFQYGEYFEWACKSCEKEKYIKGDAN